MSTVIPTNRNYYANPEAIVQGDKYRFTVLTSQLIRLEYNENNIFEDHPTQTVLTRNFSIPNFKVINKDDSLEIITEHVHLKYDKKKFSKNGLSISIIGAFSNYRGTWQYGEDFIDLKGTARTLDKADGAIELSRGLISRNGFSVFDDSNSLILLDNGWVEPRKEECIDLYYLGYGHDYKKCLKDFYKLSGETPLIPRYALGNWWSRYYKYNEEEYKDLISKFEEKKIPFSVSVMDMDWHIVDVDPKYGSGWTGYSWNKDLFPNPKEFMSWLHEHNLKVTLNVHPANGIQPFEDCYLDMAKELGKDFNNEEAIEFDITDKKFMDAYFKYAHHINEDDGVDFWWIDWQQGGVSKVPGLDPLWMLNHYHYLDSGRRGNRRLTFSRYAGLGSHRYPIGFSGDTVISWDSLDFQPYFTANASNVGYGWWSHDIGGHMKGVKDDELATRWVQFGVFSPINRLHSSDNLFSGKEPWSFNETSEKIMTRYLRLRHDLIPYIYTMNKYSNCEGRPLILPMYYEHPDNNEAYLVQNEYYFGTDLIVCPITKPIDKKALVAPFNGWLPKGEWYDFFNGRKYIGGRKITFYRDLNEIPVLAKAGSIIPLSKTDGNIVENPVDLEIRVFVGNNGSFTLWEDDGDSLENKDSNWSKTEMILSWGKKPMFNIMPAQGNVNVIPSKRNLKLNFVGIKKQKLKLSINNEDISCDELCKLTECGVEVSLTNINICDKIQVFFETDEIRKNNVIEESFEYLNKVQMEYDLKSEIYNIVKSDMNIAQIITTIQSLDINPIIFAALCEILSAY